MEIKGITVPDGMNPLAVKFMEGILGQFETEGKLNGLDSWGLYMLASNINRFLECEKETQIVTTNGRGSDTINPVLTYQKQIQGNITVLLKEMGLTLGSRSKMKTPEAEEDASPVFQTLAKIQ